MTGGHLWKMSGKVTEIMEQRDGVREPTLSDLFQVYFEETEVWVIREEPPTTAPSAVA